MLAALSAASGATKHDAEGPVVVLLHPGRSRIGQASVERVFAQFDCIGSAAYATVEEAEAQHARDVGFLLDIRAPFTDPTGARRDRGVVFAHGVRR